MKPKGTNNIFSLKFYFECVKQDKMPIQIFNNHETIFSDRPLGQTTFLILFFVHHRV